MSTTSPNHLLEFIHRHHFNEVFPADARADMDPTPRLNLLIHSLNYNDRFGGINTALHFFNKLKNSFPHSRIIVLNNDLEEGLTREFSDAAFPALEEDCTAPHQILAAAARNGKTIAIRKNDVFLATTWWSAHSAHELKNWQTQHLRSQYLPLLYLIQDYECGFYPWNERYDLCLKTYENQENDTIAIFNTYLLRDYLQLQGHRFLESYAFQPQINSKLMQVLQEQPPVEKRRKILLYGRPTVERNCFDSIYQGLIRWREIYPHADRWFILSLGETFPTIPLGSTQEIVPLGKASLAEYAAHLRDSAIGVSLMVSPHPSYPPLEMSHFGLLTLTNNFANKKMEAFHENLFPVDQVDPITVANKLVELCEKFEQDETCGLRGQTRFPEYLKPGDPFDFSDSLCLSISQHYE